MKTSGGLSATKGSERLMIRRFQIQSWVLPILLIVLAGLYFYLMKPAIAGFLYDDGMYLMAAKALATGHGYRLIDIVGQPLFYKYPPLYPLVLAGMWLLQPHFPTNIVWLKSLNIALILGNFALLGYYFRKYHAVSRWVSLGLLAWMGTNWHLIEVTIEMMSEPLFLLLTTLTLIALHETTEKLSKRRLLLLIVLSVAAFYTRTMGLTLILAGTAWLAIKISRRDAIKYLLSCMLLTAPWFAWSSSKPNTTQAIGDFLVRSFQETYFQSFKMDLTYEYHLPDMLWHGIQELLGTAAIQFFPWLERVRNVLPASQFTLISLALSFTIVLLLGFYTYRAYQAKQISPSALYIIIYLAVLPFWSFYQCYPRFLVVILPFLLVFLLKAIQKQVHSVHAKTAVTAAIITAALITNSMHLSAYLAKASPNTVVINSQADVWADYSHIIQFLKEKTPENAVIYTDNADETYLYALNAQRKALDVFLFLPKARIDQACPHTNTACLMGFYEQNADATWQLFRQNKVGYIVINRMQVTKMPSNSWFLVQKTTPTAQMLLIKYAEQLRPVAQTGDGWITVYQLLPNPTVELQRSSPSTK